MSIRTSRPARSRSRHARPRLTSLEGRCTPAQFVVTSGADSGPGTLRAAVEAANVNFEADTITFDVSLSTVELTTGAISITEALGLAIDGAGGVTVTAVSTQRHFKVIGSSKQGIAFRNLAIALGGGVSAQAQAAVSFESCTFSKNEGGAAYALANSSITFDNCALVDSGVAVAASHLTMRNTTVTSTASSSDNEVELLNASTAKLTNCTIAGDAASGGSGGVSVGSPSESAAVQVDSSILGYLSVDSGSSALGSHNLVRSLSGKLSGTANLVGIDPGLLPLGNYGGPTPTLALRYNSPAINAGSNPLALATDQRGLPREQPAGLPDIGAAEGPALLPFVTSFVVPSKIGTATNEKTAVVVNYDAPTGIDLASIGGADLAVSGPQAVGLVTVAGIAITGNKLTVTYQFAGPGGSWDWLDNGTYVVSLAGNQVFDKALPAQSVPGLNLGSIFVRIGAVFMVDATGDDDDGDYGTGRFTLREATERANLTLADDTIAFDPAVFNTPKTILISSPLALGGTTVVGPGAGLLTISGGNAVPLTPPGGGSFSLSGLTLANAAGGAIHFSGGGLFTDCVFRDNAGGAINFTGGKLNIVRSHFVGNASVQGGAISMTRVSASFNEIMVSGSSFDGNSASGNGGAVNVGASCVLGLTNSTLSGNQASSGGAVYIATNSRLTVRNSTLAGNSATVMGGGIGSSSGQYVSLSSSIVANNSGPLSPDIASTKALTISGAYNLVGVADGGNVTFPGTGNLLGTIAAPLDAKLGPLAFNGGPTPTHALLPGSPAINSGNNSANLATDQRGFARVVGGQADIGAFEVQATPPAIAAVTVSDGTVQRSMVTQLAVTFSETVVFPNGLASAFQVTRTGPGGPTGAVSLAFSQSGNTVVMTFVPGGAVDPGPGGSLIDGRYSLTVVGAQAFSAAGLLDGDGDGQPGGDALRAFHRLFGDADGNGSVDAIDLRAFRLAFGTMNAAFSFVGVGPVDAVDFGQFRERFGISV